jgi:hypothetical protein
MWHDGRGNECIGFWWGNLIEGGHLEHLGGGGRVGNIEMVLKEIGCEGVDWINLALDRDNLWVVVNMLMYL